MYSVITEENPQFVDIHEKVSDSRPRVNFQQVANDLRDLVIDHQGVGHIVIEYAHDQVSNVVYALRRQKLEKFEDYTITKTFKRDELGKKVEQIIITPVCGVLSEEETTE